MQVMTEYKSFGEYITELYQANHYTRDEIANVLSVTPERMMEIETGADYPNEQESFLLENILHVDIARLKQGEVVIRKTDEEIEAVITSILNYLGKTQKYIEVICKFIEQFQKENSLKEDSEKLRPKKVNTEPQAAISEKRETAGLNFGR